MVPVAKKKEESKQKKAGKKYVYFFGGGSAEGKAEMKNLLGGKGANLAEMARLGIPVPPGFTITTEVCTYYMQNKRSYPDGLKEEVEKALQSVEAIMGCKFGDPENPLLVSVRSGARRSMPGMMETVLNIGLTTATIPGLIKKTNNERFVWDAYRRLLMMYSDVVMEKAEGIEPEEGKGIRVQLERIMDELKSKKGYKSDTELTVDDLKYLCDNFKKKIKEVLGKEFPDDAKEQLWGGIGAVFMSWNGKRAVAYRRIEGIPDTWGTACNVQAMVFGNMGETSGTGVGFTRDPATGENVFYGEWLPNAQGEDVVAGIRTPYPINEKTKTEYNKHLPSLEVSMPECYKELERIRRILEVHYRDMLDIEFTIQEGKLWMLQCRVGKRTGVAAVRMAVEMCKDKDIKLKPEEAVLRVPPQDLVHCLLPMLDPKEERDAVLIGKGLPAGPGGAYGKIVLTADAAAEIANKYKGQEEGKVVLVREETSPEDIHGMHAAQAILTSKGGMTSHAALVARGWGKCCVVGCSDITIDMETRTVRTSSGIVLKEGDWISLNGTAGKVYKGKISLIQPDIEHNKTLKTFMAWVKKFKKLKVRTNADTPKDASNALKFGAEGIGLFRIEHMFYGEGSEEPLFLLRKMIMSKTAEERIAACNELYPYMKEDIKRTLEVMNGLPVTIRLLDPPLHEFVPKSEERLVALAEALKIDVEEVKKRAESLRENNPMMGHRGVRLGITYPEITRMQVRAIFEAAAELLKEKKKAFPEIMVPVTSTVKELEDQKKIVDEVYQEVCKKYGLKKIPYLYGTMIETPRAALTGDKMATVAEFFSFGTNDLTQMNYGFSRDDIGSFLPHYLNKKILDNDPFQTLDIEATGELIKIGITRGRKIRPELKVGICGEHGGDPESVKFCHRVGMNYVSCSPFRVPIAQLAAAQAALEEKTKKS
jgi:pyruvate,orthophosphate dikinase